MEEFNQFQFKTLANFCFDLAKAWFVAGIITPVGAPPPMSFTNRVILFVVGAVSSWLFVRFGLFLGEGVTEK